MLWDRTKIAKLFADERCSQAILVFLDNGCRQNPLVTEEVAASEASGRSGNARSSLHFEGMVEYNMMKHKKT